MSILSELAVAEIVRDLTDRKGLSQEWGTIEEAIKKEIILVWQKIIQDALDKLSDFIHR